MTKIISAKEARKKSEDAQEKFLAKAREWAAKEIGKIEECIIAAAKAGEFETSYYFHHSKMEGIFAHDAVIAFREIFKDSGYKVQYSSSVSQITKLIMKISWEEEEEENE